MSYEDLKVARVALMTKVEYKQKINAMLQARIEELKKEVELLWKMLEK